MSAAVQIAAKSAPDPRALADLLHSLSQPLTTLHCILELSLDRLPEQSLPAAARNHGENISAALHQTDRVIAMVQRMRDYLETKTLSADNNIQTCTD
jgi:hypothetical protein